MDVGQIQFLLLGGLRITMKFENAKVVTAVAVALRSKTLPGAQDREHLAHFEFSLFEEFHGCGTCFYDAIERSYEMNPRRKSRLVHPHVLQFQEERARIG